METLLQDVRFGIRILRRNPSFTITAIAVLALGIGGTTAIFSLVNSVLLRALPYPESERLVVIQGESKRLGPIPISYPAYLAWRQQTDVFEQVATFVNGGEALSGAGEPELIQRVAVSANVLELLGIKPELGRGFRPEEEPRSAPPVAMLTHEFWQRRFNSDPNVLGQKLTLTDRVYTIVGVLPDHFFHFGADPVVVIPLRLDEEIAPDGLNFLMAIGRIRRGLTPAQAQIAAKTGLPRVQKLADHTNGVFVIPLQEFVAGNSRPLLLALLGAVTFVLLIAAANTANLLLARATAREKEIAIRLSLGAARTRLIRQLLTESILVALAGGALGTILGWGGLGLLVSLLKSRLPRNAQVQMDLSVLAFTAVLSLVTGVLFGLAPAIRATRVSLQQRLKQGGWQSGQAGSQRLRNGLVVVEIAFSLVLLAGAGLLVRSFARLLSVDKGFVSDHVLTMGIWPPPTRYPNPRNEIGYLQEIVESVRTLPGVKAAGFVTSLPMTGSTNGGITIEGRPDDQKNPPVVNKQFVQGDYFSAMRIRLLQGRLFRAADNIDSAKVVIIDQSFARQLFPGENPLGKHIDVGWGDHGWSEVVGVVEDSKLEGLDDAGRATFYALISQKPELLKFLGFNLAVLTTVDPASAAQSITRQVHQIDKNQAVARIRTMDEVVDASVAPRRAPLWLFGVFSAAALLLAAVGIYGVLSSYVVQRRQEIGVRIALGAQRQDVLRLIMMEGSKLIGAGLACGLMAAVFAARALTSLLFGVKPGDVPTFVGVSLLLAFLALLACALPALRATRVDPLAVLRNE